MAISHIGFVEELKSRIPKQIQAKELQGVEIFRYKPESIKSFLVSLHDSVGLDFFVLHKKFLRKLDVCSSLTRRERTKDGYYLLSDDNIGASSNTIASQTAPPFVLDQSSLSKKYPDCIDQALRHILQRKSELACDGLGRNLATFNDQNYLRQGETNVDFGEYLSIHCHPSLPFLMLGGKGFVEICSLNSLKSIGKIKSNGLGDINHVQGGGQRLTISDTAGNLSVHQFDPAFVGDNVFSLKKTGIIDFCLLKPSVIGTISQNGVNIYDTLLPPKRQLRFKQPFTKEPTSICALAETRIGVMRKNQVLIYDIRMQKLQSSKQLSGRGRSMAVVGNQLFIGQNDSRVRVFDLTKDKSEIIKVFPQDEKDKDRISIDGLSAFQDVVLALTSEGSIFYLPKIITF